MSNSRLKTTSREIAGRCTPARLPELRGLLRSRRAADRLRALLLMRCQLDNGVRRQSYFDLARRAVPDRSNDCRWQALIVLGHFIADRPEDVWEVVREHGISDDSDMRSGVATVLLEHLLEHHRRRYLSKAKRLAAKSRNFAETLSSCWEF